jgi:hypothetical protein
MNNLLFTVLIIALLYYFFYYLPQQKKLTNQPLTKLTQAQFTQTDPNPIKNNTLNCPGPESIPDPQKIKKLQKDITQKENIIIGLNKSYEKLEQKNTDNLKTIKELQSQIRDLAQRPSKPTNSQGTQTDELTTTLDTLIKDIQDLNNSL